MKNRAFSIERFMDWHELKSRIARRKILFTVFLTAVLIISILAYKAVYEPFTFDPKYGVSSLYGFDFYDPQMPFTVYYVKTAQDISNAAGDFRLLNQTLQLGGKQETVVEWEFNMEKYLEILASVDGKLNNMTFLVTDPNPQSIAYDTRIELYVNDLIAADIELSTGNTVSHTWNLPLVWDIPGSNFAFGSYFAQIEVPIDASLVSQAKTDLVRFKLVVDRYINWNIKYVAVKLYSDYTKVGLPWWRQNQQYLPPLYLSLLGVALVPFALKRRSLMALFRRVNADRLLFASIFLGVASRLMFVSLMNFSNSFDLAVYRNVDVVTYFYGIDTRAFINMYGPIWHVLLMAFYPIYLLSPLVAVPYIEILVVKLPIIISDLIIAYLLYHIGKKLAGEKTARWLMIFWLLNPYAVYMSGIWGIYHVLPTMLGMLALDRLAYSEVSQSASALAATILSGLYRLLTFPAFIIPLYKRMGRAMAINFVGVFLVTSAALLLPWAFSVAIFANILYGPGRVGFPSVSYSFLLIPPNLWGYWTVAMIVATNTFLIIYIYRKSHLTQSSDSIDFMAVNEFTVLSLLFFMLSSTLVFPTYILAAIPQLFIVYFITRKVPLSYIAFFMLLPVLWLLYWPFQAFALNPSAIFRDVFGLDFSILTILIIIKLMFKNSDEKLVFEIPRIRRNAIGLESLCKAILLAYLLIAVFAPWIELAGWQNLWSGALNLPFFALSVTVILLLYTRTERLEKNASWSSVIQSLPKVHLLSISILSIMWLYSLVSFASSIFWNKTGAQEGIFYFAVLVLWLPLMILDMLRNARMTSLVTFLVFVQVDYAITRNYYSWFANTVIGAVNLVVLALLVVLLFLRVRLDSLQTNSATTGKILTES